MREKSLTEVFSRNLMQRRKKMGLRQEDVAARANVVASYISMLERGQRTPSLDMVTDIAKALKVKAREMLR